MNLFTVILDGAVAFVRRNPLFCLLILMLALFAPSVLGGIAMFVLYFILGIILLVVVLMLVFRWRIYRLRLGVQSYSPAVEAAIRLTQEYQGRRSSNASTFLAAASARFPIWGWMHLRR